MANYKNDTENDTEEDMVPKTDTTLYDNNVLILDNNVNTVAEIFNFYEQVMETKIKRTPKREKKIVTRLKLFSVDDIKTAIRNVKANAFMMGDNDSGRKWNQIELICRSDEKLEEYLGMVPAKRPLGQKGLEPVYPSFRKQLGLSDD